MYAQVYAYMCVCVLAAGVLLMAPVFNRTDNISANRLEAVVASAGSAEWRASHIAGSISAVFRLGDLLQSNLASLTQLAVVVDAVRADGSTVLLHHFDPARPWPRDVQADDPAELAADFEAPHQLSRVAPLRVGTRLWTARFYAPAAFANRYIDATPWLVVVVGAVATVLAVAVVLVLLRAARVRQHNAAGKAQFLSCISHELRTPLTGVLGGCELLDHSEVITGHEREVGARAARGDACGRACVRVRMCGQCSHARARAVSERGVQVRQHAARPG